MSTNLRVYCETFGVEVCFLYCHETETYEDWKISNCIIFILCFVENRPSVRDLRKEQHEHTKTYRMVLADLNSHVLSTGYPPDEQRKVQKFVKETELISFVQFFHRVLY